MSKLLSVLLVASGFLFVLLASASRLISGTGKENLVYQLTGYYNGHVMMVGLMILIAGSLASKFIRTALFGSFFDQSEHDRLWLFQDGIEKPGLLVTHHLIIFTSLSLFFFYSVKDTSLFLGVDGDYSISIAAQQKVWMDSLFSFTSNFLQGMGGNVWFPFNTLIDPGYIIGTLSGSINYEIAHTVWALLLFSSTFFLARTLRLNLLCSLMAAWLSPCLILFPSPFQLSSVPQLIPHLATSISICSFMIAIIIMDGGNRNTTILRILSLTLLAAYFLFHNPTFLLVAIPIITFCGLMKLWMLKSGRERFLELSVFLIPTLLIALSGGVVFFAGLYLYTAVYFFPEDFVVLGKSFNSISFTFNSVFTPFIFVLFAAGIFSALMRKNKTNSFKTLVFAIVLTCSILFMTGVVYVYNPEIWDGPSINYFEFMLWPLYTIFIVYFSLRLMAFLHLESVPLSKKYRSFVIKNSSYIFAALILTFFLLLSLHNSNARYWAFPPPSSPIMDKLADISHQQGGAFKGRVATFTGQNIEKPVSWSDLQKMDYGILGLLNNDFRKAGLWFDGIPTLTEYNQLITPRFHFFAIKVFGREGDKQVRNMLTLRNISTDYLALMGVSKLITDRKMKDLTLLGEEKAADQSIYLYALKKTNVGQYSPVNSIKIDRFEGGVKALNERGFNPENDVVVEHDLPTEVLLKALHVDFTIEGNQYKLKAQSSGVSLLVLPVEYSTCFRFKKAKSSGELKPRILPVDLAFVGILFEKDIDAVFSYRNGPFTNSGCRFADYRDFKQKIK